MFASGKSDLGKVGLSVVGSGSGKPDLGKVGSCFGKADSVMLGSGQFKCSGFGYT